MLKIAKKVYNIVSFVLIAVIIVLVVLLWGVKLFGLEPYTVLSGSMEPKYHVGSIIYVTEVTPDELKVGDPLTFNHGGNIVTHEIVEIIDNEIPEKKLFVTQGLTNNVSDGNIPVSCIVGKPVFSIPYLGYVSTYIQNPVGMISIVCGLIIFFMISFVFDLFPGEKKDEKTSDQTRVLSEIPSDPNGNSEEKIKNKKENK